MKRTKEKKYWYHCTKKDFGEEMTFEPRGWGEHRCDEEPKISRTCVGPKISNCIVALPFCMYEDFEISVYRTKNKVYANHPYKVGDSKVTREKWLTKDIKFVKVGEVVIRKEDSGDFAYSSCIGDKRQIKLKQILRKNLRKRFRNKDLLLNISYQDL